MIIPERYRSLEWIDADPLGRPRDWPAVSSYPPAGFLPISVFELGNGDVCGFYWPIGREGTEPLLCETYHDSWQVEPHASSLEGLVKLRYAEFQWEDDDPDLES